MALPSYEELTKSSLPSYDELTTLPSYEDVTAPSPTPATDKALADTRFVDQSNPEQYYKPQEHPVAEAAAAGAIGAIGQFIPRSIKQGAGMAAELATPVVGAVRDIAHSAGAIKDWIGTDKPMEEIVRERYPESQLLVEADKTPAFSKERFQAGFTVLANMGMLAAGGKALSKSVGEPVARPEEPPATSIPPEQQNASTGVAKAQEEASGAPIETQPTADKTTTETSTPRDQAEVSRPATTQELISESLGKLQGMPNTDVLRGYLELAKDKVAETESQLTETTDPIQKGRLEAGLVEARTRIEKIYDEISGNKPKVVGSGAADAGSIPTRLSYGELPEGAAPSEKLVPPAPQTSQIPDVYVTNAPDNLTYKSQVSDSAVTSDEPHVSTIANRFTQERATKGEIGEVAPGQGLSTADLVQRGLRMSPEKVTEAVSRVVQGGDIPVDDAAAIRGEEARLSQRSNQLSRAAQDNPSVEAQLAADNAFKDLTDFHNGPVAQLKENWANQGRAMQGEIPVDLSTFNGLREQWLRDTGEAPPTKVEPTLRRTAESVSKAVNEENGARSRLAQEVEKQTTRRKYPTADEVRDNIRERMGLEPCR